MTLCFLFVQLSGQATRITNVCPRVTASVFICNSPYSISFLPIWKSLVHTCILAFVLLFSICTKIWSIHDVSQQWTCCTLRAIFYSVIKLVNAHKIDLYIVRNWCFLCRVKLWPIFLSQTRMNSSSHTITPLQVRCWCQAISFISSVRACIRACVPQFVPHVCAASYISLHRNIKLSSVCILLVLYIFLICSSQVCFFCWIHSDLMFVEELTWIEVYAFLSVCVEFLLQ